MANEAFALSPISARAASPTDADFEAIRDAFLETARGRWFLDEYTRRNRNADTAMVLEAVARIEDSLAVQKEEQIRQAASEQAAIDAASSEPPSQEVHPSELPAAMAAVKAIVAAARDSAAQTLAGPVFDEALAPARKCARVIREIAWGLRESGADGRICFLLESQVDAINAACDRAAALGLRDDVLRAFDQAASDIESLAPSPAEPEAAAESVELSDVTALSATPALPSGDLQIDAVSEELFEAAPDISEEMLSASAPETITPVEDEPPLQIATIAVERDEAPQAEIAQLDAVPEIAPEPVVENAPETVMVTATIETAAIESVAIEAEPASLGASLIASGIIARPVSPRSDLLAPIRRMSQAEKVAFFS